jgi:hypothetical protein
VRLDEGFGGSTRRKKKLESMLGSITNLLEDRRRKGIAPTTKNCFDRNWHLYWLVGGKL